MIVPVRCEYESRCSDRSVTKCSVCEHNVVRHKKVSYFTKAEDNPIPNPNPRVTYDGPAEQTNGYKCPVCGGFTNPYRLGSDNCCEHCGFELNVGR